MDEAGKGVGRVRERGTDKAGNGVQTRQGTGYGPCVGTRVKDDEYVMVTGAAAAAAAAGAAAAAVAAAVAAAAAAGAGVVAGAAAVLNALRAPPAPRLTSRWYAVYRWSLPARSWSKEPKAGMSGLACLDRGLYEPSKRV